MTLRFLLDEDISPRVAEGLRRRDFDAISVHEVERARGRVSDEAQLEYATTQGRVLITYNRRDFQILDAGWRRQGRQHSGILWCTDRIIPRQDFGAVIRALTAIAHEHDALVDLCLPLPRPPAVS